MRCKPITLRKAAPRLNVLTSLWGESAEHVARHVPDTRIRELSGVGHFAPVLAPELLSEEVISFIKLVHQPA